MKHLFRTVTVAVGACLLAACSSMGEITLAVPDADVTNHITRDFTCQGAAKPLRFRITNVPKNVTSLALIFEQTSAENSAYVHWVVYNAPASTGWLTADRLADGAAVGLSSVEGAAAYIPPCPEAGLHRYRAEILGLDGLLTFDSPPTAEQLRASAASHIVARGEVEIVHNTSADYELGL